MNRVERAFWDVAFWLKCPVRIVKGAPRLFPHARDMAMTEITKRGLVVRYSPRLLRASEGRLYGVLMHEVAHVYYMAQGKPHSERQTDRFAEKVFAERIYYDLQGVQTIEPGEGFSRPRPSYLPR